MTDTNKSNGFAFMAKPATRVANRMNNDNDDQQHGNGKRSSTKRIDNAQQQQQLKRARVDNRDAMVSADEASTASPTPTGRTRMRSMPKGVDENSTASSTAASIPLGLVRVQDVSCPVENSRPTLDTVVPVVVDAIIGRASNSEKRIPGVCNSKIALEMDFTSAPGVSRQQLRVVRVTPNSFTVVQPQSAINPVGIYRFISESKTMSSLVQMSNEEEHELFPGDILVMDWWAKNGALASSPRHMFRVVSIEPLLPLTSTARNDSAETEQDSSNRAPVDSPDHLHLQPTLAQSHGSPEASKRLVDKFECLFVQKSESGDASTTNTNDVAVAVAAAPAKRIESVLPTQKPAPGDRVRAWYGCNDAFGRKRGSWFFGTAQKLLKHGKVEILFDDNEIRTQPCPAKDAQFIYAQPDQSVFSADLGKPNQQFAYDANPTNLEVGDLVFVLYQNGASSRARFRGVVASVDKEHNAIDVAYDDSEFECKIPVSDGNVYLVERGRENPSWMLKLKVVVTTAIDDKPKEGTIKDATVDGVLVKFPYGLVQVFAYEEIAKLLTASTKQKAIKILVWPGASLPNNEIETTSSVTKPVDKSNEHAAIPTREAPDSLLLSSEPVTSNNGSVTQGPASLFPVAPLLLNDANELVPLDGTRRHATPNQSSSINTEPVGEMHPSIDRAFWNSLNSRDTYFGTKLFRLTSGLLNEVPGIPVLRNLIELISFGPKDDKGTPYPDGAKMGLAYNYLNSLTSKNPTFPSKLVAATLPSYWADCVSQVTCATFCESGDESRTTVAALRRVGNSLEISASCQELCCDLLDFQLKYFKGNQEEAVQQKSYRNKAILSSMLEEGNGGGVRQLVKSVARATAHVLIWYGHHILNCRSWIKPEDPVALYDANDKCHREGLRLVSALGRICANVAWLFSFENDSTEIMGQECANLIQEAIDAEFVEKQDFDPRPFLPVATQQQGKAAAAAMDKVALEKHWARVKFHFVLSIVDQGMNDNNHLKTLRKCLAYRLGIQELYDMCHF